MVKILYDTCNSAFWVQAGDRRKKEKPEISRAHHVME
jgi:hypothetical protein